MPSSRARLALLSLVAAVVTGTPAGAAAPAAPRLVFHGQADTGEFGTIDLVGLPASLLAEQASAAAAAPPLFACYTEEAAVRPGWPAVLGTYRVVGDLYRFRPRFPFEAGAVYICRPAPGEDGLAVASLTFTMPSRPEAAAPRVVAVYPAAGGVPANLLRCYIHFSAPMWTKGAESEVRLLDENGREIKMPFVPVANGLWDRDARRLTLFFHPGRIKRGVAPHDAMGPPLEEGKTYELVVGAGLRDAAGRQLAGEFRHRFEVVAADREKPDVDAWALTAPMAERSPLTLVFPEPLDQALVTRFLSVRDAADAEVAGRVTVQPDGRGWSFVPDEPWRPGSYRVAVNPALEDLAGNTPLWLFDSEKPAVEAAAAPTAALERHFTYPSP